MQKGVETITGIKPAGLRPKKTSQKAPTPWGARDLQDLRRRTCDTFVKRVKVDLHGVKYRRKYISHNASEHPLIVFYTLLPPFARGILTTQTYSVLNPPPPSLSTVLHLTLDADSFRVTHHCALCLRDLPGCPVATQLPSSSFKTDLWPP